MDEIILDMYKYKDTKKLDICFGVFSWTIVIVGVFKITNLLGLW